MNRTIVLALLAPTTLAGESTVKRTFERIHTPSDPFGMALHGGNGVQDEIARLAFREEGAVDEQVNPDDRSLTWNDSGERPCGICRSTDPADVDTTPGNRIGPTSGTSRVDAPPAGGSYHDRVVPAA